MQIKLDQLIPTQAGIRNPNVLPDMIELVKQGGIFTKNVLAQHDSSYSNQLIQINKFEDGSLYIHDGMHRTIAIHLGGRDYLYEDEYNLMNWTYAQYNQISFTWRYFTPFDPRIELRDPFFFTFKTEVERLIATHTHKEIWEFIQSNKHRFCVPRTPEFNSIERMSQYLKTQISIFN